MIPSPLFNEYRRVYRRGYIHKNTADAYQPWPLFVIVDVCNGWGKSPPMKQTLATDGRQPRDVEPLFPKMKVEFNKH